MVEIAPDIIAAAQASERATKIPASVSIAQYGDESGWGKHMPLNSNNPFGIKARPGDPFVMAMTTEYVGGKPVREPQPFRKFATIGDAFAAHAELLATAPVYAAARAVLPDVDGFVNLMAKHYATEPNYATIILGIIKANDLEQYDVAASPVLDPVVMGNSQPGVTAIPFEPAKAVTISPPPPKPLAKPTPPVVTPARAAVTVGAGVAVAATGAAVTVMHGIDLTPILNLLIQTAGLILTGFASWALAMVANYAHVSKQSALMQNVLAAVDRGIAYAQNQATTYADAHGNVVAGTTQEQTAVNYVVSKMPGALKSLGMTPAHVADLVVAKLPAAPAA